MPKFPHDDFSKTYLTELLSVIGKAVPNRPLKAETHFADLWFELDPKLASQRSRLGLLGELLDDLRSVFDHRDSLIEVFRKAATNTEIRTCQGKFSRLEGELNRKAKRQQQTVAEEDLPHIWLIMPTASDTVLEGFGLIPTLTPGVYNFHEFQHMSLIVVHQLPKNEETLWLRILGREGNQKRAIEELTQHPKDKDLYANIEELLTDYRAILEKRRKLTPEDEELIMNLSAAYLQKQQEWKEAGIQTGIHQVAIAMLKENLDPQLIVKTTGLPIKAIKKLQKDNNL
jgi:hypothetical protein